MASSKFRVLRRMSASVLATFGKRPSVWFCRLRLVINPYRTFVCQRSTGSLGRGADGRSSAVAAGGDSLRQLQQCNGNRKLMRIASKIKELIAYLATCPQQAVPPVKSERAQAKESQRAHRCARDRINRANLPCSAASSLLAVACRKISRCLPTPSFTALSGSPITGISNGCVRGSWPALAIPASTP